MKWERGKPFKELIDSYNELISSWYHRVIRCHGGEGLWVNVADECFGYNQVVGTIYSYLLPEKFFSDLPDEVSFITLIFKMNIRLKIVLLVIEYFIKNSTLFHLPKNAVRKTPSVTL